MGIVSSKEAVLDLSIINKVINENIVKYVPTGNSSMDVYNIIRVGDNSEVYNNSQIINITADIQNFFDISQQSQVKNSIDTDVIAELEKKIITLIGDNFGKLYSEESVTLTQYIENNIKNINITEITPTCLHNFTFMNSIVAGDNAKIYNNRQEIGADIYSSCVMKLSNNIDLITSINNEVQQKVKIEEENIIEPITDAVESVFDNIVTFAIIFVVFVIFIILGISLLSPKKKAQIRSELNRPQKYRR